MFFQKLLFSQAQGLIALGRKRIIQMSDRLKLIDELNPQKIPWQEERLDWSNRQKFLKSLVRVAWPTIKWALLFQVIASLFSFATPFLLNAFITELQTGSFTPAQIQSLVFMALAFGLCGAGNGISIQHYFYTTLKFNQIATNVVNKKIFSHALKLSNQAKNRYQVGDIVNYMSSDSDAIADGCITTIDLMNAVVLLVGCTISLFYFLGWSAAVALVVMGLLIPITQHLSKSFMHLEDRMMSCRDQRMTLMTQILNAIRVVKYFVWEKSVYQEVSEVRRKEIDSRYELAKAEIFWGLIYTSISSIVLFTALLTHVLRGYQIDLALVFTCISIFALMEDHFGGLSRFISRFINILVSSDRIISFLKSDEIDIEKTIKKIPDLTLGDKALKIDQLNFSYDNKSKVFTDLNLSLLKGQSLAVVGPVGVGKTTLLNLLMAEVKPQSGQIILNDKLKNKAFVPQDAFIVNSSLKENIIFGTPDVSEAKLKQALQVTALEVDLKGWNSGVDTEIGEKGVNLSGGQKQRVSLARAFVAHPDLVLLDDPLSAVDPDTEKHLCEKLIFGEWKNQTRVVVTHRLEYLNQFDQILFLDSDQYYLGTFEKLKSECAPFERYLKTAAENKESETIQLQAASGVSAQLNSELSRITEDEDRAIGSVEKQLYWKYIQALGGSSKWSRWVLVGLFTGAIAVVAAPLTQKLWLSQSSRFSDLQPLQIVLVYGILGVMTMIVTYLSNSFWVSRGIKAGQTYHDKMIKAVLSTSIRFFDSTPVGRVLQRFSRDVESVDVHLQWSFDHTIHALFHVTISFLLILFVVPIVIIFFIPIMFVYYRLQNDYRRVAREVKRLDSLSRSPRYAHFKEVLNGLTVIRAFDRTNWAMSEFYKRLYHSTEMFYTHYMVNRWFSTRLPVVGAAISASTCLMIVYSSHQGWIAAGTAGLVTLYAIDFWRHLNWGVRIFSDLESRMTSVERLEFYAQLPTEKDIIGEPIELSDTWPENGALEFNDVSLKYADHLPLVLKNVSFKVKSGERVGLVGRTGSGKSTLFQAVYRFVNLSGGEIKLDHVPIQKVPLRRLRKNLAVIPQDPALFMGSLRSNIDRFGQATDTEVWTVLKKVSLDRFVQKLPNQLEFKVAENGANLSQGQRQLICLARALLMKVKVIFLDEATASVDVETDALVQKVIRESLDGITLVTIAHRLSTLEGYDQTIELQHGRIVSNSLVNRTT